MQQKDSSIRAQQACLKALRSQLEVSQKWHASDTQALERANAHTSALQADNLLLQTEAAKVGYQLSMHWYLCLNASACIIVHKSCGSGLKESRT